MLCPNVELVLASGANVVESFWQSGYNSMPNARAAAAILNFDEV